MLLVCQLATKFSLTIFLQVVVLQVVELKGDDDKLLAEL